MTKKDLEKQQIQPSKRIAVIEDDYTIRDIVEDFLKDEGFDCGIFVSPEEFHKSSRDSFDIIISDILLQDKRSAGVDLVVNYVKECPTPKNKKIIFISNFGKESIEDQLSKLEQLGCKPLWLRKPFSMLELYKEINRDSKND